MAKKIEACHKSTYCRQCPVYKPPPSQPPIGTLPPKEKLSESHIETTTQLLLRYPQAHLKLVQVEDEVSM